jgi:hypothetical protein
MHQDDRLYYGARVPLPRILEHRRFHALSKVGLELRRAAASALNEALVETGTTRVRLSRGSGIDYAALSLICTAKRSMDVALLKQALAHLGRDWRRLAVTFTEAFDRRGRSLPWPGSREAAAQP